MVLNRIAVSLLASRRRRSVFPLLNASLEMPWRKEVDTPNLKMAPL